MCVCVRKCECVYLYVSVCVRVHVCMSVHVCMRECVCMCRCVHVFMCVCFYMYACLYVSVCVCVVRVWLTCSQIQYTMQASQHQTINDFVAAKSTRMYKTQHVTKPPVFPVPYVSTRW